MRNVFAVNSSWKRGTRTLAASLLGAGVLGAGYMPANAQQNAKYASNVVYVPCTQEQAQLIQKAAAGKNKKKEDWGTLLSLYGVLLGSQNSPNAQKLGSVASTLGRMEHEKQVAREGRTKVIVNQGQQQTTYFPFPGCTWVNPDTSDLSVRRTLGMVFAANYWKDFNRNGGADLEEFMGVNDKFYDNEDIILVIHNPWQKSPRKVSFEIHGPKGLIYENLMDASVAGFMFGVDPVNYKSSGLMNWLVNKGGHGDYIAVWNAEGITEMKKFEIIPSSEKNDR